MVKKKVGKANTKRQKAEQVDFQQLFVALGTGLENLFRRHLPSYAPRVRRWMEELTDEYLERQNRDGRANALNWLLGQLRDPQLPDLRRGRSLATDEQLVLRYRSLKERLAPIFEQYGDDTQNRNVYIAPLVSDILGRSVSHEELSTCKPLAQFCLETLNTDKVQMSRARQRVKQEIGKDIERGNLHLEAAIAETQNPEEAKRWKRALKILRQVARDLKASKQR